MPITQRDLEALGRGADQDVAAFNQRLTNQKDLETKAKLLELLKGQNPGQAVNVEGISIGDPLTSLLRGQSIQNVQDERSRRAVQDVEDRATKANTAQTVPALKRGEEAIPGLFTSDAPINLKSVGGAKNLIPNMLTPFAEQIGMLPEGSSKERTALQELQNAKVYDSSGKQINESEMRRIKDAMGLRGMFGESEVTDALRQMGNTAFEKQKQVSAGADPSALNTFKERGGLAGYKSLPELLGKSSTNPTTTPTLVKTLRNKKTGQIKEIYSDGSEKLK